MCKNPSPRQVYNREAEKILFFRNTQKTSTLKTSSLKTSTLKTSRAANSKLSFSYIFIHFHYSYIIVLLEIMKLMKIILNE